jgi:thiamine-monophosphate kinase
MKTVEDLGENRLITRLQRLVPGRADVITGIGDDCAVVRGGPGTDVDLLLKSDPVIEGIHFAADARPESVGHKAIGRVLSDLAAMGGEPLWALIDLVAPGRTPVERIERIYRGAARLARRHGLAIVGGDTSRGTTLELHVFAVGRVPRGRALLRSGARPGDVLCVTGLLGGSLAGRHLTFAPRVQEGQWLLKNRWATALMDVSDGLAADVPRLAASSGVGVVLEAGRIPVSAAARRAGGGRSPLEHALGDGEDFELLFTVRADRVDEFEKSWKRQFRLRCTRIGEVTREPGVRLREKDGHVQPLLAGGYEHFR